MAGGGVVHFVSASASLYALNDEASLATSTPTRHLGKDVADDYYADAPTITSYFREGGEGYGAEEGITNTEGSWWERERESELETQD